MASSYKRITFTQKAWRNFFGSINILPYYKPDVTKLGLKLISAFDNYTRSKKVYWYFEIVDHKLWLLATLKYNLGKK